MRTTYTGGVLDAFMDAGVDLGYVIGVSAGANAGSHYVAGQRERSHRVFVDLVADPRYAGWRNVAPRAELVRHGVPLPDAARRAGAVRLRGLPVVAADARERRHRLRDRCGAVLRAARPRPALVRADPPARELQPAGALAAGAGGGQALCGRRRERFHPDPAGDRGRQPAQRGGAHAQRGLPQAAGAVPGVGPGAAAALPGPLRGDAAAADGLQRVARPGGADGAGRLGLRPPARPPARGRPTGARPRPARGALPSGLRRDHGADGRARGLATRPAWTRCGRPESRAFMFVQFSADERCVSRSGEESAVGQGRGMAKHGMLKQADLPLEGVILLDRRHDTAHHRRPALPDVHWGAGVLRGRSVRTAAGDVRRADDRPGEDAVRRPARVEAVARRGRGHRGRGHRHVLHPRPARRTATRFALFVCFGPGGLLLLLQMIVDKQKLRAWAGTAASFGS